MSWHPKTRLNHPHRQQNIFIASILQLGYHKKPKFSPSFSDSIERFEGQAGQYLQELQQQLKTGLTSREPSNGLTSPK